MAILQQICVVGNISTKDSSAIGLYANQQKLFKMCKDLLELVLHLKKFLLYIHWKEISIKICLKAIIVKFRTTILCTFTQNIFIASLETHKNNKKMADANPKAARILALRKAATKDPLKPSLAFC